MGSTKLHAGILAQWFEMLLLLHLKKKIRYYGRQWCFSWSNATCRTDEPNLLYLMEGNVNDALDTFYLRLYGVIYMVKDHSDSERGNPLSPLLRLLFPIRSGQVRVCNVHIQKNLLLRTPVTGTCSSIKGSFIRTTKQKG